jgi:RHS repeat-associated protein
LQLCGVEDRAPPEPGGAGFDVVLDNVQLILATTTTPTSPTPGAIAYTYDAENRMTRRDVTGGSMTYTYDANGTMVKRTNADGSYTVYIGGIYEVTNTGIVTKYYQAHGRTIAMRVGGTLSYLLADHLGSTVGLLDTNGNPVANSKTAYWPYGGTRSATTAGTDKLYTGQQVESGDAGLGLYNYKARFYSTVTGRFVSADPLATDSLNRYSYVRNSPEVAVDPQGLYLLANCGWQERCDNGGNSNDADWGDINDWRNLFVQYWKSSGRFGSANLDDVFNLFVGAKLLGVSDSDIVNTFDADIRDTSHGRSNHRTDADNSARELETFVHNVHNSTGQNLTHLAGFSWGGVTANEFLWAAYNGETGFDMTGLDLKGVLYIGAPRIHCNGVCGLIGGALESGGAASSLGADGSFDLVARGVRVVARSSPYYAGGRNTFRLGEIRGGAAELRTDDARSLGACEHCVWSQALWWDAHDLFGLTD